MWLTIIKPFRIIKMLTKKFFVGLLEFVFYFVFGNAVIPAKYCSKLSRTFASCRMNYIWNDTKQIFVSVLDQSFNIDFVDEDPKSITLKAATNMFMPYISIIGNKTTGYVGELFEVLQEKIGFKVELQSMDYDNGLESIENGSADILLSAAIGKGGLYNTKFMQPYIINWYKIYFKSFGRQPTSMYYFGTLASATWFLSGATVIILCIILWATLKLLATVEKSQRNISLASCFIATLSGYLNQGFEFRVQNASYRVQTMTALLFGYIIATAINANLVAKITTSYEYFPIKAIHELENQQQYGLCIRTESFVYNNFSHYVNGEKVLLDNWINVVNVPKCGNVNNKGELKAALCKDNLLFLENTVLINHILKHNAIPCQLAELPQKLFKAGNSIVINKFTDHRFNNTFNVAFHQITESGIRQLIRHRWFRSQLSEDNEKVLSPVTMQHMNGIFVLHVFFMVVSLVVLLFEILVYNSSNNSIKKRQKKKLTTKTFNHHVA